MSNITNADDLRRIIKIITDHKEIKHSTIIHQMIKKALMLCDENDRLRIELKECEKRSKPRTKTVGELAEEQGVNWLESLW